MYDLPFNQLDDDSFELALYEMTNGNVNLDADRLACLKFNPLSLDNYKNLSLSQNIDPDSNFYSDICSCDYYTEGGLSKIIQDKFAYSEDLSFLHLNIRSLGRNFDNLTNLLSLINHKFSIIGISETWLQDSVHTVDINEYNFVHNYQNDRSGGGIGLYLSLDLEYKLHNDLTFPEQSCVESLFVEITTNSKGKNIIVGTVYRPPNQNVHDFINSLNILMGLITKENKICYIMGDFNLNLMNHQSHQLTAEFLDVMFGYMFFPLITLPTRELRHILQRLSITYLPTTQIIILSMVYCFRIFPITCLYFVLLDHD